VDDGFPTKENTMIDRLTLPVDEQTGEFATLSVTTRESTSRPAVLNVRFLLPGAGLVVTDGDALAPLPETPDGEGLPIAQIPVGLN
jgi:hypothetical protein